MYSIFQSLVQKRSLLFLAGLSVCLYSAGILWFVSASPDIGIQCAFSPTIRQVEPRCFLRGDGPQPVPGDQLVRVADYELDAQSKIWSQVLLLRTLLSLRDEVDVDGENVRLLDGEKVVRVQFRSRSSGQVHEIWCRLGTLPFAVLLPSILWFVLKLGLFVVGALVYWNRPHDVTAAQFFTLCIVTVGAYMGGYHWVRISTYPLFLLVFMACSVLLPAVSLHFFMLFPRPKEIFIRQRLKLLAAIYLPPLLFLAALIVSYVHIRTLVRGGFSAEAMAAGWSVLVTVVKAYLVVAMSFYLASVVCLVSTFRSASDPTERKQVEWIMVGSLLALVPIGYTMYLVTMQPDDFGSGAGTWPMFAASALLTIAFAVSITRYRLMQLDQLVSSGVVYFLLSFVASLVYYTLVLAGMVAADVFGSSGGTGPSFDQTLWVGTSFLVLLFLLDFARSRFKKALDRRFDREKHQLERTIRRMGEAIEQLVDPPTLARRMLRASVDLLQVSGGAVYLRDGQPPIFQLAGHIGTAPALSELTSGCPLLEALAGGQVIMGAAEAGTASAAGQLAFLGGEVAQPLVHENKLLAILILGPKTRGQYAKEDFELLSSFAQLTALALASAEGHRTIELLNRELNAKVQKISEQQRRILALQSQLMRLSSRPTPARSQVKTSSAENLSAALPTSTKAIVGSSAAIRHVLDLVRKVSATSSAVLLRGESGTGKELLAQAIHDHSERADKPFVKVHCAALSPGVLESELFGHVKGAFTGAHRDKIGRFELADQGTLFLDEIGDVSLDVQTKLLRVLQEKTFERVGSSEPIKVDVRIIAATHQNLEALIEEGRFRRDLYYRLKVIDIVVPPLRERREDIPELALYFLESFARRSGRSQLQISDDAMILLKSYHWPGNIRELENVIERAVVVAEGDWITPNELPIDLYTNNGAEGDGFLPFGPCGIAAEREERHRRERERLVRALAATNGNKAEAARLLGLARSTLVSRLKKFGLS
ncbi:MAG: hypothetical protein KatS3mg105_4062 [Gemmatales bacterium]|nr:MAG: hypothetical protein KatS3mg105_4062 [Gemmatales bacterium]